MHKIGEVQNILPVEVVEKSLKDFADRKVVISGCKLDLLMPYKMQAFFCNGQMEKGLYCYTILSKKFQKNSLLTPMTMANKRSRHPHFVCFLWP